MRTNSLLLPALLLLAGCANTSPERTDEPSNKSYKIDQLFVDRNGYTVYRFWDEGEFHYYVVSPKGETQVLPSTRAGNSRGVRFGMGVGVRR